MVDDDIKRAAETLENKANSLIAERTKLRLRMTKDAVLDMQMTRDINGCISGASALGFSLELAGLPAPGTPVANELTAFIGARNALMPLVPYFSALVPPDFTEQATPVITKTSPPPMPKVADIILDRLRAAGKSGTKAADIRNYILQTYHAEIHEKTVGMTLYRLQDKGRVRRDGHTWFLASAEAGNPGAVTPGPNNAQA